MRTKRDGPNSSSSRWCETQLLSGYHHQRQFPYQSNSRPWDQAEGPVSHAGHGQAASAFPTPRLPRKTISMPKPCSQQSGHIEIFPVGVSSWRVEDRTRGSEPHRQGCCCWSGWPRIFAPYLRRGRFGRVPCQAYQVPKIAPIHAKCPPLGKKFRDDLRSMRSRCRMCAIYRRALLEERPAKTRSQSEPRPQSEKLVCSVGARHQGTKYATNHVNLFLGETLGGGPLGLALISASPSLAIRPPWKAPAAFATSHHTAFCRNTHHVHVSRQSIRLGFAGKVSSRRGNNSIAIDHHRMLQVLGFGEYSMSNLVIN
jgi:hypothetical protein